MRSFKKAVLKFAVTALTCLSVLAGDFSGIVKNNEPVNVYASTVKYIKQKKGTDELYINRLVMPDYAKDFYYDLLENSKDSQGYLVDYKKAVYDKEADMSYVVVTSQSGTMKATSKDDLSSKLHEMGDSSRIPSYIYETFFAFFCDHPEVFWIPSSPKISIVYYGSKTETEGVYNYRLDYVVILHDGATSYDIVDHKKYPTTATLLAAIKKRDVLVKKILKRTKRKTAFATARAINDYLTDHNEYNSIVEKGKKGEAEYTHHALCALEGNKGKKGPICMAYALAFKLLCDNAGIPCITVCGKAITNYGKVGGHQWNKIKLDDGKWYEVDCTWNDTAKKKHGYFAIGSTTKVFEKRFSKSHIMKNSGYVGLPGFTNEPPTSKKKYRFNKVTVKLSKTNFTYTGKSIKPKVTVYFKKKKIAKKFYKVKYVKNVNVGTGTVIVKFKGKYKKKGTKYADFTIAPAAGEITSVVPEKGGATVNLGAFKGANGFEVLYSTSQTFDIASTGRVFHKGSATSVKLEKLKSNTQYYIKVRSVNNKNGKVYYGKDSKTFFAYVK